MFLSRDFVKKINKQFFVVLPFVFCFYSEADIYVFGIMLSADTPNYISQRKCIKTSFKN